MPAEPTVAPDVATASGDLAIEYLRTVADGDLPAAWDLLAQRSRDALGSQAEFEALGSALAEGLAAYDDAPDLVLHVTPIGEGVDAVTLSGTVSQEGTTRLDATAMIVRPDGVSPFEGLATGDFVLFSPMSGAALTSGDVVRPSVESGSVVAMSINGEPVDFTQLLEAADPTAAALPVAPFAPGRVGVTVVLGSPDALVAYAAAYDVAD